MSHGVIAFLILALVSGLVAFTGVAPELVEACARAAFAGFGTLFLVGGALTRWTGPSVQLRDV